MNSNDAFRPGSLCYAVDILQTPTGPIVFDVANEGDITILAYNPGPNTVFFAYGNNDQDATANAAAPIPGTPFKNIPLGPGSIQTFTFNAKQSFAAVAVGGTQRAYFVAGYGL